ncbi:hypothetical protein TCAL_15860 [Tigriopus californicus]|uniref:Rhodanese domain-containing protein n=1 Tax=Tigriopus californicus TaxID=6832 RepID=A0A553NPX8_TIGCA|nr:hypothetical protein TCAL_15860 [Tigriopus californicus]
MSIAAISFGILHASNGLEINPISTSDLLATLESGQVRVFDARSDFEREVDGYILGSELLPMDTIFDDTEDKPDLETFKPKEDGPTMVVYVSDKGFGARKAESVLKSLGFDSVRCYFGGLDEWKASGGDYEFPRFVKFQALNTLLDRDEILLIDVRNRTELNTVGQIPKSVCLPLHEVELAFDLSDEDFQARYSFPKPQGDRKDIVLTCRSGRRVLVADRIMKTKGSPIFGSIPAVSRIGSSKTGNTTLPTMIWSMISCRNE